MACIFSINTSIRAALNSINRSLNWTCRFIKLKKVNILQADLLRLSAGGVPPFPPAQWRTPHGSVLQEFTSVPVVIPRQWLWCTDVSLTAFLRQNSLAPYLTPGKRSNCISYNRRREKCPTKTGGWAQKGMMGRQREPSLIGALRASANLSSSSAMCRVLIRNIIPLTH